MSNTKKTSFASRLRKLGVNEHTLKDLLTVSRDGTYVYRKKENQVYIDNDFVDRAKKPVKLYAFMRRIGLRYLVVTKVKPGMYQFVGSDIFGNEFLTELEMEPQVRYKFKLLEAVEEFTVFAAEKRSELLNKITTEEEREVVTDVE